jgi:hypothetical protein
LLIKESNSTASAAPFVEIAHQQHRIGLARARAGALTKRRHQPVGLQSPFSSAQPEMCCDHAQNPITDQQIGIDRAPRFAIGDGKVKGTCREHREPGQDSIAEASSAIRGSRSEDHTAANRLRQINPLIGTRSAAWTSVHLLQASNVGINLSQHRNDTIGVATPVDTDAGMNVVGAYPNRG